MESDFELSFRFCTEMISIRLRWSYTLCIEGIYDTDDIPTFDVVVVVVQCSSSV